MNSRAAIENTLANYVWSFDLDEVESIGDTFTAHAQVVSAAATRVGRDAIVADLQARREVFRTADIVPWHLLTSIRVLAESAGRARVTSFYTFLLKQPTGEMIVSSIGYYDDLFVVDQDRWRVDRRRIVAGGKAHAGYSAANWELTGIQSA